MSECGFTALIERGSTVLQEKFNCITKVVQLYFITVNVQVSVVF